MKKLHNLAINLGLILGTLIFTLTVANYYFNKNFIKTMNRGVKKYKGQN